VSTGTGAYHRAQKFGGTFTLNGMAAQGKAPEEVEKALIAELERVQREGISEEELQKAKNQSLANHARSLDNNLGLATALTQTDAICGYEDLLRKPEKIKSVTREDVQRVAKTYLTPEGRNTLIYLRKSTVKETK
jgi:predicted Zn-dependent peptidase